MFRRSPFMHCRYSHISSGGARVTLKCHFHPPRKVIRWVTGRSLSTRDRRTDPDTGQESRINRKSQQQCKNTGPTHVKGVITDPVRVLRGFGKGAFGALVSWSSYEGTWMTYRVASENATQSLGASPLELYLTAAFLHFAV
jgi:hypothetical protein